MSKNPHQVTKDFEQALCEFTGARYAVTTSSCTMALLLAVAWHLRNPPGFTREVVTPSGFHAMAWEDVRSIEIPKRTYVGVPMSIIHAGGRPVFRDEDWTGAYQLKPLPVWDSARWFTKALWTALHNAHFTRSNAYPEEMHPFVCVSFHASKTLGLEQGGAILHDDPKADAWLRMARFDGRQEGVDPQDQKDWIMGHHCYLSPSVAAQGILKLYSLPRHNAPLPNDPYPDLSTMEIFK